MSSHPANAALVLAQLRLHTLKRSPPPMNRRLFLGLAAGAAAVPLFPRTLRAADSTIENSKIAADRKAALDILKPSAQDLQHGLELHAASVVLHLRLRAERRCRQRRAQENH